MEAQKVMSCLCSRSFQSLSSHKSNLKEKKMGDNELIAYKIVIEKRKKQRRNQEKYEDVRKENK